MAFAIQVSVVFGGPQDDAQWDWNNTFAQLTGIDPDSDESTSETGYSSEGNWTYTFHLYSDVGPYTFSTQELATAAIKQPEDGFEQAVRGKIVPRPKFRVVPTGTRRTSQAQEVVIAKEMEEKGATPEEIQETLQEVRQTEQVVLREPATRAKRTGPTRPARTRDLQNPREWMGYVRPGDTEPYWKVVGLDRVPDTEVVDPETWRMVYRAWYRTTEKRKDSQKQYNEGAGRAIQKEWEKTDLGKQTRGRYFKSKKGVAARKASQARSKQRLALGKALREENPDIPDDEIERIFYQQNLRPQFKTPEDFENWLRKKYTERINPATGDELV
tara:strand:+ start:1874 stop:2860 length:987 start_codon:yes stop_codon:yes gene_type:complete